ncbi:MAG: alpha/beta fold hydrolase [Acidimicrobiales bacterium]
MLYVEKIGAGDRVVLLHGFTQSGRTWRPVAERLARRHRVVTVDAPGHGGSAAVSAGLWDGAAMMAQAGGGGSYVGYSMGGRFALHLALAHPELIERLVVASATGGIDDPVEREARRAADEALAERVEAEGVEAFVRWWLGRPLFSTLPPEAAEVGSRLESTASGLADSLRRCGTGSQGPLWDRLSALEMPVLAVAGELDGPYVRLAERLVAAIGNNASLAVLGGAGHACHLERHEEFADVVERFLTHDTAIPSA